MLVAPTVVVTAAHCSLLGPPVPPSWIRWVVIRGESTTAPDAMRVSGTFVTHPGFCIGCPGAPEGFANNDLAVVLLQSPLPGPYAKLPKAGFVGKHFDKEKQLVAAGFGITGPGLRGHRHSPLGAGRRGRRLERTELPAPAGAEQEEVRDGLHR